MQIPMNNLKIGKNKIFFKFFLLSFDVNQVEFSNEIVQICGASG